MQRLSEKINIEIMENELAATDWSLNPLAWDLYWFVDLFQAAFFKETPVPIPALTFEKARVNTLGHYMGKRREDEYFKTMAIIEGGTSDEHDQLDH